MLDTAKRPQVNGLDLGALDETVAAVEANARLGQVAFRVRTDWKGQTKSETTVDSYTLAGEVIPRSFTIVADEPHELLGTNAAPNPQELLMSALNACITVGYVAGAALRGIALEKVEVVTSGSLDLRGFLGLDAAVKPGYDTLRYVVRIKGAGTPAQFQEIHETVAKTSPNYFNISQPVAIDARLVVEL